MDFKGIDNIRYIPLTLTVIDQFGGLFDIIEQFVRDTQQEEQESHDKPIQEQVMNRLSGMAISWSSHVAGQKSQADAIQEIRSGAAEITEWLDKLDGMSHHGLEQ